MKTLQQLQEEIRLHEAPAKAVVFMFGRFNPPTSGHERMVKRAVQTARRAGIRDVRLYPSFSQDPKRNPLTHKEKIKWLQRFFKGVKVVNDKEARSPFATARRLSDEGMKRVIMVAGGDRVKEFQTKISKYIKHPDPDKSFEFDEFQVVSAGERDPDADDATGMSASKMRAMAAVGDFVNFVKGMPSRARDSDSSAMFDAIRRAMNLKESMSVEQSDAMFSKRLKDLESPDVAEVGKCYSVVWADGRGIVAYRNRLDAIRFVESGDRDVVSVRYQDAMRLNGKSLIVRNKFTLDRSTIGEEWPGTLEAHDERLFRVNEDFEQLDEVAFAQKLWYDTKKRKEVNVEGDFHIQQVLLEPRKFGLSEKDIEDLATPRQRKRPKTAIEIPALEKRLSKEGWVLVTLSRRIKEVVLRSLDNKIAQKALNWVLDTIDPTPNKVRIRHVGAPSFELQGSQIDVFAKTGRVVKSRIAAFREDFTQFNEALSSVPKWWYNTKTRKAVKIQENFHLPDVVKNPKRFGLTHRDVDDNSTEANIDSDFIPELRDFLFNRGWVMVSWTIRPKELLLQLEKNTKKAQATLKWFLDNINPTPELVRIALGVGQGAVNLIDLFDEGQIKHFLRTGKPGRRRFGEALLYEAIIRTENWWYNVGRNKFVEIQRGQVHAAAVIERPRAFGLKKTDIEKFGDLLDFDGRGLTRFMITNGWARVIVESEGTWDIQAKNLSFSWKTAVAMDKKFGRPPRIFLPFRAQALMGNQITIFLRTGKIVPLSKLSRFRDHVELGEAIKQTKGWFDTKKNKLVELLARDINHDWAPINNPARFGLKRSDVAEFEEDMNDGQDEIFDLSDLMLSKGWVKLSQWEGIGDITWNLNGAKLNQVHKAALGMQKKFRLDPDRIFIDFGPTGPRTPAGKFETLTGNRVKTFLRTGKIVKLSKLAPFR